MKIIKAVDLAASPVNTYEQGSRAPNIGGLLNESASEIGL